MWELEDKTDILWHIDEPVDREVQVRNAITFAGWAISRMGQPLELCAVVNEKTRHLQRLDTPRPDVVAALAGEISNTASDRCGFRFFVPLPESYDSEKTLVHLEISNGEQTAVTRPYTCVRVAGPEPPRAQYKQVWNQVATNLSEAQLAVAGYTNDDERWTTSASRFVELILDKTVGVRKSDSVLEIGAGVGRIGEVLAPRCKEWIGADVSETMLHHLEQRLSHIDNVRTVALSGFDLGPILDASLDMVYCTIVFMHLDEWERFSYVKEAFRVLKPGGRLYVDNFNLCHDDGWAFFLKNMQDYHPLERPSNISKSSTPQELEVYLRRAGFEGVKTGEYRMWVHAWGTKPA